MHSRNREATAVVVEREADPATRDGEASRAAGRLHVQGPSYQRLTGIGPEGDSEQVARRYLGWVADVAAVGRELAGTAPKQDWFLAAGLAVFAQVETWATPSYTAKLPMTLLAAAITIPLTWRRRAPVTVLAVGLAAGLVFGSQWPTVEPIYQIFALLIACYSVGVYAGFRAGLTSVMLVMLLGQTRVLYSMANDGLLPKKFFAEIHPKFRTPWKNTIAVGLLAAIVGSVTPIDDSITTFMALR